MRVSLVLAALFGFSLFVVTPAYAAACTLPGRFEVTKAARPTSGVEEGDIIRHIIRIRTFANPLEPAANLPCDVTVELEDFHFNSTFLSADNATCTAGGGSVTCTYAEQASLTGALHEVEIRVRAEAPPTTGRYCDGVVVRSQTPPTFVPNGAGPVCANAAEEPPPPRDGGGGGVENGDEGFGFGGGGFGDFGTGFSTVSTPLGGVDTGAGGTAGSNAAVPQIALASLLTIGLLLFGIRRLGRA
ncbi:MAG: hypothetical protein M3N24_05355 [Actinomycetota bacterium]|nr:hypothetical protein [Actinomycetota bacterium]